MSSEFDTFATAFGVPPIVEHNKERSVQPEYHPPKESGLPDFTFDGIVHIERGDQEYDSNGDLIKITRLDLSCATSELTDNLVFELQTQATVSVNGCEWGIDMVKSNWTPSMVVLGLRRRQISRTQEMENHAAV